MEFPDPDLLTEIATALPAPLRPGVEQPPRSACPDVPLPLDPAGAGPLPPAAPRLRTAGDLAAALAEARQRHAPFLQNLSPALPTVRTAHPIDRFQWRIEDPADRTDFAGVVAGAGAWTDVAIPHYGPPLGIATTLYRAVVHLPAGVRRQERVYVRFLGVDYRCEVYLNGALLGCHEGFFDAFEFDATAALRATENVLVVRVHNDHPMLGSVVDGEVVDGDKVYAATGLGYDEPTEGWHHCPPAMGIYNRVLFEGRARVHVEDLWVRPRAEDAAAELRLEIRHAGAAVFERVQVLVSIFGRNFAAEVCRDQSHQPEHRAVRGFGDLDHGGDDRVPFELGAGTNYLWLVVPLGGFRAWDLDTPWLYQAQVKLLDPEGRVFDAAECQFGMRSFVQDEHSSPRGRFRLNGREVRLRGANTMGHLERCVMRGDPDQLRDDILLAKLTHLNFLRLTQRPVHREVYEACDRLGLLLQTDLPLFGTVRRNQFEEVVRQAGRMERHVRAHASSVLVSFINEPRPAAAGKPHRFLVREELESMFRMCAAAVHQENPDRVVKCVDGDYDPPAPFGMPDNHCYSGWYIGHGVDLGALHHGAWMPVKPGWHFGCGEFGAEALDSYAVMRRYYPSAWQPADPAAAWSPVVVARAQTPAFHFLWYDTPVTAADWIAASQRHQAWSTRLMTAAFRRNPGMNSFAIHLFIDAWPAGWMKAIMDVDRAPKAAWFEYRDALTPTAVLLRSERTAGFGGETIPVEVWVCQDRPEAPPGWQVRYTVGTAGKVLAHGAIAARIAACAPVGQGLLRVQLPTVPERDRVTVTATLCDASGAAVHDAQLDLEVFPPVRPATPIVWSSHPTRESGRLLRALGCEAPAAADVPDRAVLYLTDYAAYESRAADIDRRVAAGASAVFLSLPPGQYVIGGAPLEVRPAAMGPRHFVSRATSHPLVAGFEPDDFKFWHSSQVGRVTPLLRTTLRAPGWETVLQTGDGEWLREWAPVPAAVQRRDGAGCWRVCQVDLSDRVDTNPAARLFALRLFSSP